MQQLCAIYDHRDLARQELQKYLHASAGIDRTNFSNPAVERASGQAHRVASLQLILKLKEARTISLVLKIFDETNRQCGWHRSELDQMRHANRSVD